MRKVLSMLSAAVVLALAPQAFASQWVARHALTSAQYQAEWDKWSKAGYRLTDVSGYEVQGQARYAALWEQKSGPAQIARHGLSSAQYQAEVDKNAKAGWRLVLVNGYGIGNHDYYVAIWEKGGVLPWVARHGLTSAQYQVEFDKNVKAGYRPVHVSGYAVGGQERYAAIWEKRSGPQWLARHGLSSSQYQADFDKNVKDGFRPVQISGYGVGSTEKYAAIWEKSGGPIWAARHALDSAHYQYAFDDLFHSGYRPRRVSGFSVGGRDRYAGIWENTSWKLADLQHIDKVAGDFLKKYDVPGLSMAIAKDGRLVFAKGYGTADKAAHEGVHTASRFRIASVSKPLTSAAIMKLMQENPSLTEKRTIFGAGGVLGTAYGHQPYKNWVTGIQLGHLLHHTGGGWANDGSDPMFSNPSMNHAQLITWTLDNLALKNAPGTKYAYSNFGYSVLGRVIEKVSGKPYATYVKEKILAPAGVHGMEIAGDTLSARKPHEVVYYDGGSSSPYNMKVARMDSHGGWIASAIDLVRFGVRVDGFPTKPDVLSPTSIKTMTTASSANGGYACGWSVNSAHNWWHNGSLPGTFSILVRTSGGFVWSALINSRKNDPDVDKLMWDVVNGVKAWPAVDHF